MRIDGRKGFLANYLAEKKQVVFLFVVEVLMKLGSILREQSFCCYRNSLRNAKIEVDLVDRARLE